MRNKVSILVIDDSKLINNALEKSLSERGFEVTQAFDVNTAKEILHERGFDYALLDLELPDGSGEDVLPYLQIYEEIRVIVLTSDRDKQRREYLFNFGVVIDYITKERYFADMELAIVTLIERVSTNHNLNIMVVDDSKFMRNQLRILLTKRGFNVFEAIDGKNALELLKKHRIDGAIIDLEMPVMDGNKLLSAIKKDKANLLMPVMVVSGTSDPDKIARVIKNGASDFIKKPYVNEELLLKIDKMMQDLKQQRLIKIHEAKFAMYNKAIDEATIFFKLDSELRIIYANSTFCDLFYNANPNGLSIEDFIITSNKEQLIDLKQCMCEKKIFQSIVTFKNKSLQDVNLRLTCSSLLDEFNKIDEILVIGFDVSLLQEKEEILKERIEFESKRNWEQNKILIQQSKMASMGEMIGHIGHQWRQPLNSLSVMFQKLNMAYQRDKLSDTLMNNSTKKAMRIITQMSKTIDDFRDFFKSDKEWSVNLVSDVIRQALNVIEPTVESKGIKIVLHTQEDISCHCLKNELSQVILNIIANAMDAIVLSGVEYGEIMIAIDSDDRYVTIIIDDNAGGIPEEIMDRIFEPYFTTKEKSNGTGIGLYMSKTIIEEHLNGKLEVDNALSGASFKIKIPIEQRANRDR